jgi:hypothetical protein
MDEGKTSFEQLLSVMPEGWKAKAKELGALARGWGIKNAIDLLRLVFLYLTEGQSLSSETLSQFQKKTAPGALQVACP